MSESAPLAVTGSVRALAGWRSRSELLQDSALAALFLAAGFIPPLQANGLALGSWPTTRSGSPGRC